MYKYHTLTYMYEHQLNYTSTLGQETQRKRRFLLESIVSLMMSQQSLIPGECYHQRSRQQVQQVGPW